MLPRNAADLAARAQVHIERDRRIAGAEIVVAWSFEWSDGEVRRTLRLAADGSAAGLRVAERGARRGSPLPSDLFAAEQEAAEAAGRAALAAVGWSAVDFKRTGAPTLRYDAVGADAPDKVVSIALDRAQATVAERTPLGFGRLLQRLHTAHGYGRSALRSVWAVIVDLMSAAMVLWSVTGVLMWWQKRSHRRTGAVVLAAAFGGAIALGLAMHAVLGR